MIYATTTNLWFGPDYFKWSSKVLMEWWGEFCFVSLSLYGTAVGDFGMRRPDKAAWGCFAVIEHCDGDTEIIRAESRSWGPPSQGHLLHTAQLRQCIQYQGKGMLDVTGMHCEIELNLQLIQWFIGYARLCTKGFCALQELHSCLSFSPISATLNLSKGCNSKL